MLQDWNIRKLLEWSTQYFQQKDIESARLDSELLLAHVLGLKRVQLYMQFDRPLNEAELQNFKTLLKRRSEREPLAYILGKKEFYSLEFDISPAVLIPRPETELLVENALKYFSTSPSPQPSPSRGEGERKILDIGTGSGCIAVSLAKHLPEAQITAIDISPEALKIAKQNAEKHGVENQISFHQADFLLPSSLFPLPSSFDLIVSNPPYIQSEEIPKLAPELQFEPRSALEGGIDGLDFYKVLLPWSLEHLNPEGRAFFEIGFDQAESLEKLATNTGFQKINILKDYAGHPRVIQLTK